MNTTYERDVKCVRKKKQARNDKLINVINKLIG